MPDIANPKLSRELLGLAGEYAVASELCRRGLYAQLTMGNHKQTDILVETGTVMMRIQVKAKQSTEWPAISGLYRAEDFLILVDFTGKSLIERPDFYVLDLNGRGAGTQTAGSHRCEEPHRLSRRLARLES
jgi:predicted AAA+ superfamily ATPase